MSIRSLVKPSGSRTPAFIGLAMATLLLQFGCSAQHGANEPDDSPAVRGTSVVLHVRGLSCPLCANSIEKQLKRLARAQHVLVDLGSGRVTVNLSPGPAPTHRDLRSAIDAAGFTLDRIEEEQAP
ncbi:MAG: heavy-metal-associated domain-containing protein [Planctomycetia bacterium]|nr:MAG: heavy-metal-associated domain-containing protein [Planctomycetia bacterium]